MPYNIINLPFVLKKLLALAVVVDFLGEVVKLKLRDHEP